MAGNLNLTNGYGVQQAVQAIVNKSTGSFFYVANSSNPNIDALDGLYPPDANGLVRRVSSLTAALASCTASTNNTIFLAPGHTETISGAAGVAVNVAGVSIIGLGNGADRPTFTFGTSTAASMTVTANSVSMTNIVGIAGIDGLTKPFDVTGDDFTLQLEWQDASSTVEAARAVLLTGVNRGDVTLTYRGFTAGDACVNAVRLVNCSDVDIHMDFYGKASTAVVEFLTTACVNINVDGYFYVSGTTNFTKDVVDTATGSTWFATGYDGAAGSGFSGGSGAALAGDDVSAIAATLTVPTADSTANTNERDVIGNKTDAATTGAVGTTKSLMGYVKQCVTDLETAATGVGTTFTIIKNFVSSSIPNNTQTGGALTGASTGGLVLQSIILQTDTTGLAGPTNIEISTDNVNGLTGAGAPNITKAVAGLGANKTVICGFDASSEAVPLYLESGKKLYIDGDDGAGSGAGTVDVIMTFTRVTAGATIAAA